MLPSQQGDLTFLDWFKLVGGLMPDTPLGQVVAVRAEKDAEIIRRMSSAQKQIRKEWSTFRAQSATPVDTKEQMRQLSAMLAGMFG